jgi:8-oxo-dGTP pyrophosphatase MutT (NUDIX family)
MKRSPKAGFIPGAWVFPGGTLDPSDGDTANLRRIAGLSAEAAQRRFGDEPANPPAFAYWVAAIREAFEETGILPGLTDGQECPADRHRSRLLSGQATILEVLDELEVTLEARVMEYVGHWVTPTCEPRRYETRFFLAEVGGAAEAIPHEAELVEALWFSPADALSKNQEGSLPLVFPTLLTLEDLMPFSRPDEALEHFRGKPVRRRLPEPDLHPDGVSFFLAEFPT